MADVPQCLDEKFISHHPVSPRDCQPASGEHGAAAAHAGPSQGIAGYAGKAVASNPFQAANDRTGEPPTCLKNAKRQGQLRHGHEHRHGIAQAVDCD